MPITLRPRGRSGVRRRRWLALAVLLLGCAAVAPASAQTSTQTPAQKQDDAWSWLKGDQFGDRPIADGSDWLKLDAPYRAQDAAIVPIDIVALKPQTPDHFIKAITLIIDQNPAPVAAVFRFGPGSASASISTRVRVNDYTEIRAVAETGDGRLVMVHRFVKASGGCSAPALKDPDAAMAHIGDMRLRQFPSDDMAPAASNGDAMEAQLSIRHPNYSGLQMNQLTRNYIPARYVQDIQIRAGDALVLSVEGGISLSQNPTLRFRYRPDGAGVLKVHAKDSDGAAFEGNWPISHEKEPKG